MAKQTKEDLRAIPVLHAGWPDMNAKEQPLGVGQEVAFAPFDLFPRVEAAAARPDRIGTFDTLTVDDGGAGLGVFFRVRRSAGRKASLIRGHQPLAVQRVSAS